MYNLFIVISVLTALYSLIHFPFILGVSLISEEKKSPFRDFSERFLIASAHIQKKALKGIKTMLSRIYVYIVRVLKDLTDDTNPPPSIWCDFYFQTILWENIRNIIGEKKFFELQALSKSCLSKPLLHIFHDGELWHIDISLYCEESKKPVLQSVLTNLITLKLQNCGYYHVLLTDWKISTDDIPYIEFRFAYSDKEKNILQRYLNANAQKVIVRNSDIIDDTEEEDLT